MLTRTQVARRIGKSVATVRRLEGRLLEPVRDRRGVHRFEESEVEELAGAIARGELSLSEVDGQCGLCGGRIGTTPRLHRRVSTRGTYNPAEQRSDTEQRELASLRVEVARLRAELEESRAECAELDRDLRRAMRLL